MDTNRNLSRELVDLERALVTAVATEAQFLLDRLTEVRRVLEAAASKKTV